MPLLAAEGIAPQLLKIQFSYFSGRIAWRPVLVSLLLLLLSNIAGFILLSKDVAHIMRTRLHLRRGLRHRPVRPRRSLSWFAARNSAVS